MSFQLSNLNFEGLVLQNGDLYAVITSDNQSYQMPFKAEDVKKLFPVMLISAGKVYITSANRERSIQIDPNSEIGQMVLSDIDRQRIAEKIEIPTQNMVPGEFTDKYCLLWGGHVLFSADTLEEVQKYEREHTGIAFTTYVPAKK